jgi:tetratricopeptide (TPR) repeat protein
MCDGIAMDPVITAAGLALAAGDALGALNRVALRDDAPALALRGIAMARLGEFERAKALLKRAARGFGAHQAVARARCVVAEAEIALVSRDLGWPDKELQAARATLEAHGDAANATHARVLAARRLLLIGRLGDAERMLAVLDPSTLPPASRSACYLARAGVAVRRLRIGAARAAFAQAAEAARRAAIPALLAEAEDAASVLRTPAARVIARGAARLVLLEDVEALLGTHALIVDACRHIVRSRQAIVPLATRPVLFALVRALAEAWPADVPRGALLTRAFRAREADDSHRARLRVEIGRLRKHLHGLAGVDATKRGFVLASRDAREVVVLAPPVDEQDAALLALLADGEAWSSSAVAIALGASPRTVQRALERLVSAGKVRCFGRGRSRRCVIPVAPGFPTALLLPGPLPGR